MKKSDVNRKMLFKMRDYGLCVLLDNYDSLTLYSKEHIIKGDKGGITDLTEYHDDLTDAEEYVEYDIVAIKQFNSTNKVIHHVLNDIEPDLWDWEREQECGFKYPMNITINISKENDAEAANQVYKTIVDELKKRRLV